MSEAGNVLYFFQRYHLTLGAGLPSAKQRSVMLEPSRSVMVPAGVELASSMIGGTS